MVEQNKNVFACGYHLYSTNSRFGGFLSIVASLAKMGFDVDYLTMPTNITWLLKTTDRENLRNLLKLILGRDYLVGNSRVFNTTLTKNLPFKFSKLIFSDLFRKYLPSLRKLDKFLRKEYTFHIFESVPSSLMCLLMNPEKKCIYRPSDPLSAYMENDGETIEQLIVQRCQQVWYVNELSKNYLLNRYGSFVSNKLVSLPNPFFQLEKLKMRLSNLENAYMTLNRTSSEKLICTYVGVFPVDYELIEKVSSDNLEVTFLIIGPHKPKVRSSNVFFLKSLRQDEVEKIIQSSDIGFLPYSNRGKINELLGITKKVADFLTYGKPVVAINVADIKFPGYYVTKNAQDFSDVIKYLSRNRWYPLREDVEYYKEEFLSHTFEFFERRLTFLVKSLTN